MPHRKPGSWHASLPARQARQIYALDRLVPDTEQVSLYEQQSLRLDSIKVEGEKRTRRGLVRFNPRLSGEWTVVDEGLNDASEYAEDTTNRNGYPVLNALKPNDGAQLFLRYQRRIRSKQRIIQQRAD